VDAALGTVTDEFDRIKQVMNAKLGDLTTSEKSKITTISDSLTESWTKESDKLTVDFDRHELVDEALFEKKVLPKMDKTGKKQDKQLAKFSKETAKTVKIFNKESKKAIKKALPETKK
jgi:hypothetical protein